MSVDVTKMPKLGFGMMRLPEKDGELDLEQICKMVDAYLASGMNYFDTAYMSVSYTHLTLPTTSRV